MTVPVQSTSVTSPQRKKILDVGCGQNKYPGAIGIDSNPRANADVTHDLGVLPYPFANLIAINGNYLYILDIVPTPFLESGKYLLQVEDDSAFRYKASFIKE